MSHHVELELPLTLERSGTQTLPAQLAAQLRELIRTAVLPQGTVLPATRQLALRLNTSRGTVVAAYEQLLSEGYLQTAGRSTRVAPLPETLRTALLQHPSRGIISAPPPAAAAMAARPAAPRPRWDLTPGASDSSLLPSAAWRAAWRGAAAAPHSAYPETGSPRLQAALADYLRLARTVVADPHTILITSGARDGLRQLLSALSHSADSKRLTVAVETPGFASLHRVPQALGHHTIAIPVDAQGMNPALLPRGVAAPEVVLLTPSHQYPLGASMPLRRRLELLAWARQHGSILVEDDYDSELRYAGDPLPALAALDKQRDCVATLGSFTKLLHAGVGLGYLTAPAQLQPALLRLRADLGGTVSTVVQDALTEFLRSGAARHHIARMRREYRARRNLVQQILTPQVLAPRGLRLIPLDGGLHTVLQFDAAIGAGVDGVTGASSAGGAASVIAAAAAGWSAEDAAPQDWAAAEQQLVAELAAAGIAVSSLRRYWASGGAGGDEKYGIVFGYGGVDQPALREAVTAIATVLMGTR